MRRGLIVPAVALFLVVAGVTAWITLRGDSLLANGAVARFAKKTFSTGIAEGVRFRDFDHLGVDLLTCETMRIEKLRRGGITLGAFNVLALDGVTVNLVGEQSRAQESPLATDGASDVAPPFDFIGRLTNIKGLPGKKFSSVRITRFAVNRFRDGEKECLFTAESAEAGLGEGKALRLKGCLVFAGGNNGVPVRDARVEFMPEPTLFYRQQSGVEKWIPLQ